MAKRFAKKCTSKALVHQSGVRKVSDYEMGHQLWYVHKPLPSNASPNMQQGYMKGARQQAKFRKHPEFVKDAKHEVNRVKRIHQNVESKRRKPSYSMSVLLQAYLDVETWEGWLQRELLTAL